MEPDSHKNFSQLTKLHQAVLIAREHICPVERDDHVTGSEYYLTSLRP